MTPSTKSRDEILMPLNHATATPSLPLEILSIKIINQIGDREQPSLSPVLTENVFDLLLSSGNDCSGTRRIATKNPNTLYSQSTPSGQQDVLKNSFEWLCQIHKAHVHRLVGQTPAHPLVSLRG